MQDAQVTKSLQVGLTLEWTAIQLAQSFCSIPVTSLDSLSYRSFGSWSYNQIKQMKT